MRLRGLTPSAMAIASPPEVAAERAIFRIPLRTGWALQSSASAREGGEVLSSAHHRLEREGWYTANAPTTVLAALVAHEVYPDPYVGMNLRELPGASYPIGANFSNLPMPAESPFAVPWWFRTEIALPPSTAGQRHWLHFEGINYRANVWLNGVQVARAEDTAGALRAFVLDVTAAARPGEKNVLAVEVHAPTEEDLAITFVDWNPAPPDKGMGLWREVYLTVTGPVALRHPAVLARVGADGSARLTVAARLTNGHRRPVAGILRGQIEGVSFQQPVTLEAGEEREVTFTPEGFPQLQLAEPRLWWPAQMGTPALHRLELELVVDGVASDRATTEFGIREIRSELTAEGKRLFFVNGKPLLIRGAGWAPDMMLRHDPERLRTELGYVKDIGLNTVRLEGKLEGDEFFALADRLGLLVMAGFCCCDHWEHWAKWDDEDHRVAEASLRSQLLRLRKHPSLLVWLNGSDNPPPAPVENRYRAVAEECRWPNPVLSSATAKPSEVSEPTGVKMTGPYDYVAPCYWLEDRQRGGAHGFNTETGPGPAVPPVESLRRMFSAEHLWPIDDHWNFHAGGGAFKDIAIFTEALEARYGAASGVEDFALKSQLMAYEGMRAMFEAYSRNKYLATGVIQWMLNNAWPSLIWHLYDHYLRPGGGYFGAKNACQPLHPLYSCVDQSVWLVSSQYEDARGLRVTATVYDLEMVVRGTRAVTVDAPADSTQKLMMLPEVGDAGPVTFARLTVEDATGATRGSSFYWLSRKAETIDWDRSKWYVTPTASFADFTALERLPRVKLAVTSASERRGDETITRVTVENPSPSLAFFVRLALCQDGEEVLPVLWQDNYLSLVPGERREILAVTRSGLRSRSRSNAPLTVEVTGWNVG